MKAEDAFGEQANSLPIEVESQFVNEQSPLLTGTRSVADPISVPALINLIAEDGLVIPYRPQLARLTGKLSAAILLGQMVFRWKNNKGQRFYKFNKPCSHRLYRQGDSWCEELGIGESAFTNALKTIATKVKTGDKKKEILSEVEANLDATGRMLNANRLVIYWTDANRVTWYQLNDKLLADALNKTYAALDKHGAFSRKSSAVDNPQNHDYLNNGASNDYPDNRQPTSYLETATCGNTFTTEKNSKTNNQRNRGASPVVPLAPTPTYQEWLEWPQSEYGLFFDALCFICRRHPDRITDKLLRRLKKVAESLESQGKTIGQLFRWIFCWFIFDFRGSKDNAPPTPEHVQDEWDTIWQWEKGIEDCLGPNTLNLLAWGEQHDTGELYQRTDKE